MRKPSAWPLPAGRKLGPRMRHDDDDREPKHHASWMSDFSPVGGPLAILNKGYPYETRSRRGTPRGGPPLGHGPLNMFFMFEDT